MKLFGMRASLAFIAAVGISTMALAQAPPAGGPPAGGAAAAAAALKAPFPPFHIIGNIYYVGSAGLACYLVTTPAGNILLDTGYPDMAPMIEGNIKALGFKLADTKILINSHAHIDHGGGMAQIKMDTGAQLVAMAEDAPYFESGGHNDVIFGDRNLFPPVHVDRVIHDGDLVTLGGVTLTAHLMPGHTPGNTTWTMSVTDGGRNYNVVFLGTVVVLPSTDLRGTPAYPNIGADWAKTMQMLPTIPCDVFLATNAAFFDMQKKHDALVQGANPNPFIDPAGYKAYVERTEAAYQKLLTNQPPAAGPAPGAGSSPSAGTDGRPSSPK
jgi:metallo-beta-lactamase class B